MFVGIRSPVFPLSDLETRRNLALLLSLSYSEAILVPHMYSRLHVCLVKPFNTFLLVYGKKKYSASIDTGSQRVGWGTCLRWFLTTIKKAWSCSSSILEIRYIFRAPQFIFLRAAYTGLQTWLAFWKETYWYMVLDIFFKRLLRMICIWFSVLLMICTRAIDIPGYLSLWE